MKRSDLGLLQWQHRAGPAAAQTKLDHVRDVQHIPLLRLGWILLCSAAEVRNGSGF